MDSFVHDFFGACWNCITFNGSGLYLVYGLVVLYIGLSLEQARTKQTKINVNPELGFSEPAGVSIHTLILQSASHLLSPETYLKVIAAITESIEQRTGVNKRSFIKNVVLFFLLYYMLVSAPAGLMIPVNYDVRYETHAIWALFLMMLANATGDVISLKITLGNLNRLARIKASAENSNLTETFKLELSLYLMTIRDMLLALCIMICLLLITAFLFGVSVGEYKLSLTDQTFVGGIERVANFWETCNEPYWFRPDIVATEGAGLPMLLIYSVTSFLPSLLLLFLAFVWTFALPLRMVIHSKLPRIRKIVVSELIVIAMCAITVFAVNNFPEIEASSALT